MKMPVHPRETDFKDLPAGQLNLYFIDVSNVWKTKAAARDIKNVRKILLHHHDGPPYDMSVKTKGVKTATGEDMPFSYLDISKRSEYQNKAYGYQYDVPFVEEKVNGKLVVYIVNSAETDAPHTSNGQNEIGVGISLVGSMRSAEEHTELLKFPNSPAEYTSAPGLPSANQRRIVPVLVRYVQEKFGVLDSHVQAHFQHGKPTCPGYDTERWVLDHEETARKAGKAVCYPVALDGGGVPFLKKPAEELARAAKYVRNTREGKSGFYPFGRRGFWHNGAHLFAKAGSPVYAVRDGWVIAARFEKSVKVDGIDYGSAAFVLVQHEDAGIPDPTGKLEDIVPVWRWDDDAKKWVKGTMSVAVMPTYYSLCMHLAPLDEGLSWVKMLKERDPDAWTAIGKDKTKTASFWDVALPVKAGDVIGYVGTHDPFAGMDKKAKVADADVFDDKHHAVLHFEMFSAGNLVKRLEDAAVGKKWTVDDADENALAEVVAKKLEGVEAMKGAAADLLSSRLDEMDTKDPRNEDPSQMAGAMQDDLLEPLSCLIGNHVNEWTADWKSVLEGWYREWGLAKGKAQKEDSKRIQKTVAHQLEVIGGFKWGRGLTDIRNRRLSIDDAHPHYYHPIRFLNWINGLERTPDLVMPYNTTDGVSAFDVAPRNIAVVSRADEGSAAVLISSNTGNPKITDHQKLVGTRVTVRGKREYHTVTAVTETKDGLEVTVSPPFGAEVKKGTVLRFGGNGWRWVANFKWETNLVGPATGATPTKGGGKP
jgi:murein DD-endopeptidase MepM/ murein hydrolase activator NlpD